MNFIENVKEGLRSISSNLLRTSLTAVIIAIGITALVGILTAIDGLQNEVNSSLATLGSNSFDIKGHGNGWGGRRGGKQQKAYEPIKFKEAHKFEELFKFPAAISIYTTVTNNAEVKYKSKKTNPTTRILGVNENYLNLKAYVLTEGRTFSNTEIEFGTNVAIVGAEIATGLFEKEKALNSEISFLGSRFKIIGILEKKGSSIAGGGSDNTIFIPILVANRLATDRDLRYSITASVSSPQEIENAMSEATGLMRTIRKDQLGRENSFEISRSESVAESFNEVTGYLKMGGSVIVFLTLLGASIGLMNIMMVSVTERTKEIGVRKALGATPKRIRQQFLIEAIVICQLGGVIGVILGLLVGNFIAKILSVTTFVMPWFWIITGLIVCVVVGLISGYYPAWKASKLDPIDSLRFE